MTSMKSVIVYSTKDCIECTMVKQVLAEENIEYEERDISIHMAFQTEVEKYGYLGVPVTVYENLAIKGFTNDLKQLIEKVKGDAAS
jgi:glutaredoxin-like protein NrdH